MTEGSSISFFFRFFRAEEALEVLLRLEDALEAPLEEAFATKS